VFLHDNIFLLFADLAKMIRKGDQHIINHFAHAIKKWRKARKLSIRDLAAISGIDHAMIGKYEQGLTNPTLTTICRLSDALEIDPSELIPPKKKG
jgi:transcriptional regulator with XRE-family HTH domain